MATPTFSLVAPLGASILTSVLAVGLAAADLTVLTLRSGETLVGTVRREGGKLLVRPHSLAGPSAQERQLGEEEVMTSVGQGALREQCIQLLSQLREKDGFRALQIAKMAERALLRDECLEASERALAAGSDPSAVDDVLGKLLEREIGPLSGSVRSTRLTRLIQDASAEKASAAAVRYARLALATTPEGERSTEIDRALRSKSAAVRRMALELRAEQPARDLRGLEVFYRYALYDGDPAVREVATARLKGADDVRSLQRFTSALWEKSTILRFHSAEALGALGRIEAVPALVNRMSGLQQAAASGASGHPTASLFVGEQRAYVSDYNVEVAQASAIAEPVISVLQSGVVLDARVLSVQWQKVIGQEVAVVRGALARLAGRDLGDDPKTWMAWFQSQQKPKTLPGPTQPDK
ncbi:MAG: hypothetical protein JNJ88_05940 [Planctomycetes bacterium]|nr:hypothetical protein [Planctomycetota bacterium]